MLFTTSWDDGHPSDLKVAALLEKYGLTGTFYVGPKGFEGKALSPEKIRSLSSRHEIGAHTLAHPSLPRLKIEEATNEIVGSKKWLEDLLGKECKMFAYPFGHFNSEITQAVKNAGFMGARTTKDLSWDLSDPYQLPTSIQIHYLPFRPVFNRRFIQPIKTVWPQIKSMGLPLLSCRNWLSYAKATFEYALKSKKPFFHLWGHSWALDKENKWVAFEEFLKFAVSHEGIKPVPNSALISASPPAPLPRCAR